VSNRTFAAAIAAVLGLAVALVVAMASLTHRLVPTPLPTATPLRWQVHVSGAVVTPGVYAVRPGDRVADAIRAAGGTSPDADLDYVNPAELLRDGQQVRVPQRSSAADPKGR
jgi:protein involved in polysaccharide export with SLBB domain